MGVKESHELKQLETRREKLKVELEARARARDEAVRAHSDVLCKLQAVEKSIDSLQRASEKPVVTEHAMLRYLERVRGLDLQAVQDEILNESRLAAINTLKSCRLPIGDGNLLLVENRTVKSVVPDTASKPVRAAKAKGESRGPKPAQRRRDVEEESSLTGILVR